MRDAELDERIRQVLADLAALSEVGAAQIGRSTPSSDDERGIPAGVDQSVKRARPDKPPSKDRSVYDFYAFHFARATTDALRRVLVFMAEGDLKARRWAPPEGKLALAGAAAEQGEKRDERILTFFAGTHPLEAALLESHHGGYCSEENIRAVRRRGRRDEETGNPLPGWRGWTDEQRTKAYNRARAEGKGLQAMALEFGIPKSTVQRFEQRLRRNQRAA